MPAPTKIANLVIGFGKAGKTLAMTLAKRGEQVALVERAPAMYGGTCINIACIPTKSLIHSADLGRDWAGAWAERRDLTARLRAANRAALIDAGARLIDGTARFTGPRRVQINGPDGPQVIEADRIFINTGATPARPPIPGLDALDCVYDSTTIMERPTLPARLAIIGGGFIGVEFASLMAGFGSNVTLIEAAPAFLGREDRDVAECVRGLLQARGVTILTGAAVERVDPQGDGARVVLKDGAVDADAVLIAAGRRPVTGDLGLPAGGVQTDDKGFVAVDDRLASSAEGVWALGDVNGGPQFTFISLDDYRIVLNQIGGGAHDSRKTRPHWATCVFTTPPLAHIGLRESEAQGRNIRVARLRAAKIPMAQVMQEPHGLLKAVIDADSDQILGCTLICENAQEVINTVALAMNTGVTATTLGDAIYTHPSMTEALNLLLG